MALITTSVVGRNRVEQKLAVVRRTVEDLRPFWRDVFAPVYFGQVQDRFAIGGMTRGDRGRFNAGTKWTPLSPVYAAWKERNFPGQPILVREGFLRESLKWTGNGLGQFGIWDPHPRYVRVGTRRPGAAAHQRGVPSRNLPARRFLEPPDKSVFGPLMQAWLHRSVN